MSRALAWVVLGLAACGPRHRQEPAPAIHDALIRADAAPEESSVPPTDPNGATSPTGEPHPGEIVFIDHVENRTWTEAAGAVPPTMAWVQLGERWTPVVRIEIAGHDNVREITKYGPGGAFLNTTMATLGPPPPSAPPPVPVPTPTPTPKK